MIRTYIVLNKFIFYIQVLQYKQRCSELETQAIDSLAEPTGRLSSGPMSLDSAQPYRASSAELREERITDLDHALRKLDDERRK